MTRLARLALVLALALALLACSDEESPQAPQAPPYAGLDRESPGVAVSGGSIFGVDGDFSAFNQLLWNGTLRVDHFGETPPRVHEARVSDAELAAVQALVQDPRLQAIVRGEVEPDCQTAVIDVSRFLMLRQDDVEYSEQILGCEEEVFGTIDDALADLQQRYAPFE